ncbi:DNA-binding NarL/FixJ family response regulator [Hydrogenispora ethanolica]|uniref:DNA-binding NarL/FixJ family response regulator n=1 Tax=Hydrogenispora ethanolica TaxID=1082276 RepID=A0A4R1RM88_HYDET|nr:response regulator transcription factor [Hydrogenispora ethanolica]TCL67381.1 DNA-binding NarL/FixJ family response regulator [Hydrogenispora ethanolica]
MTERAIKVLIADDIETIHKRIGRIIAESPQFEVVGNAKTGYEATILATLHRPDVILMDIEMENRMAGITATREILKQFPELKIIILTVYEEDELVFAAFQAGVVDYIVKNAKPEDIVTAIRDAYENRSPIRPTIAQKIRKEFMRVKSAEASFVYYLNIVTQLTATELDVLDLLVQGKSRAAICDIRNVEANTVKSQIHSILKKFDRHSAEEVVGILKELQIFETLRDTAHLGGK